MTIRELYEALRQNLLNRYESGEAESISRIVLEDAFEYRPEEKDRKLTSEEELLFRHIMQRLLRGEPVQYVMGEADFYGLRFLVDRRVLIPRQETEELVHWVLETWKKAGKSKGLKVLDIGTGSGCIPITLKKEAPDLQVFGLDVEADILELSAENAGRNEVEVEWILADILKESQWGAFGSFDYIISNPPYIPISEQKLMTEQVLAFEPNRALFVSDDDSLVFYREIGLFAHRMLNSSGYLFFETNEYNAERVVILLEDIGFPEIELKKDLAGKNRMIRAKMSRATKL